MKNISAEPSATPRFKINISGTDLYVGNVCGCYTAGIDYGKTWSKSEAEEAIRICTKHMGHLTLIAA